MSKTDHSAAVATGGAERATYQLARERYAQQGVDTEVALQCLQAIPLSLHCWQGDDVVGLEQAGVDLGGGLAVTGNYPGRARNADELRADADVACRLIPGKKRFNLHACYAETHGQRVARDELQPEHFHRWIDWARERQLGLDFNPTFFAHPRAADGFTLAHRDRAVRQFWIDHGIACRRIGAAMGRALKSPCVTNVWIPDGYKDLPVDRAAPRHRLCESLDEVFREPFPGEDLRDAVECKLFGLGSECYVVGSHEFYLGYAATRRKLLCLDTGHFHPTELVSDKISSVLCWVPELLLHLSRGVRWDSDHVVTFNEELQAIAHEIIRGGERERVHWGLDFFDASINRIAAWVIGARNVLKAILVALLEPVDRLRAAEQEGDYTARLAWLEESKSLPWGAVWDYYCLLQEAPVGDSWLAEVRRYEREILFSRQ